MNNDLYVVVGQDNNGSAWVCTDIDDWDVMSLESAHVLLEDLNAMDEAVEGVWKYRIAKLSFLD